MIISPDSVTVEERIREEHDEGKLKELIGSFLSLGQLQPIVVTPLEDGKYRLAAGERRLRACIRMKEEGKAIKHLEVGMLEAVLKDVAPPHVQLMMEFDENVRRADFTYVEKAKFIRRFHETMVGQADGAWTQEHTAAALRLSTGSISHYLNLEEAVKTNPNVAQAKTLKAAVKRMKVHARAQTRQKAVQTENPKAYEKATEILKLGDACELIKELPDESVDFINFDPPWGDETSRKSAENWADFDDDTETSDYVINTLLPELFRVLKNDRMMVYWYRAWAYQDMVERLEKTGFSLKFTRTPNIWNKPDKVSDQNRFPEKQLIDSYEVFFTARKGEPNFHVQGERNVFSYDRVPRAQLIHSTEKPVALCEKLLSLCSIGGETILDPTAGSASMIYAALSMGRRPIGFEKSPDVHGRAVTRLTELLKKMKI